MEALVGGSQTLLCCMDRSQESSLYPRSQETLTCNSRQARWALFFNQFDFVLSYRPGSKNQKPDAFSRQFDPPNMISSPVRIIPPSKIVTPVRWGIESIVRKAQQQETDPGNGPPCRLFVPKAVCSDVLQWGLSSSIACHPGASRTLEFIGRCVWWPKMAEDIRAYVAAWSICAQHNDSRSRPQGLLLPLPVPARPWSHISMDFVMGLPPSQGNKVILLVVDRFSKACHLVPLPKLPSAPQTAEIVLQHVFRLHGFPQDVVSDHGPQFASRFWKAFCQLIGTTASLSSGFHPQSNGQTEQTNQEIETTLRCLVSSNPTSWSKHLIWAEFAHNVLRHSSTGMSPFECQYGFQPPLFSEQESEVGVPAAQHLVQRCRRVWRKARDALLKTSQLQQQWANRRRRPAPTLRPGQKVWLSSKDLPLKVKSHKLTPKLIGPFKVIRKVNPVFLPVPATQVFAHTSHLPCLMFKAC
uniref:Gypsy retrotransposon integrase-like protein 1 n=1 Tax=Cyprinus carpio carpio TaxID=630221 RepID=A0A9J8BEN4_CYPCA